MLRSFFGSLLIYLAALSAAVAAPAEPPGRVIDGMEDLSSWQTGGQKEATLLPERSIVREGKQALRFEVRVNHQADEAIQGKQYPKGWPRIERNPKPALDLSAAGSIAFDIYTLSSRKATPGSALHIILRDESGENWSSNLGQLPIGEWRHFSLDLGSFRRDRIVHWQFFLCESDYEHGDTVTFLIDNVRGVAAQRSRELVPRILRRLALLQGMVKPGVQAPSAKPGARQPAGSPASLISQLPSQEVTDARARLARLDEMDLAQSNAFDAECDRLLARVNDLLVQAGAARTVADASYCVGIESSLRKVFRDDAEFTPGRELRLSLAANEREAGQILVRPLERDIPGLSAECSDLRGPKGARIGAAQVRIHAVGYVEMLKAGYRAERGGWWPDPLIPLDWPGSGKKGLGPLADAFAHRGETQPLWVSVVCPPGIPAGEYRGAITLKPEGCPSSTVDLVVRVRGFELPLRPRLKTAFAFFEGDLVRFNKLKALSPEQRRAIEAFLLERKMNPMLLYTRFAWPGLEDVAFMRERGLNAYCLGYAPGTVKEIGEDVYYRWLRDQRAWLARQGWDRDAWLYGYDEPHCRPDWETLKGVMREVYALIDEAAPGMPRASTTAIVPPLYDAVNLWIPQTMQVVRADTLARQKAGDQVWTYVACTPAHPFANIFVDYPALEHRLLFWQTWQEQCTGFLYYATTLWRANYEGTEQRWPDIPWNPRPVKDFEFNGDGILLYPGPNATLLSSVRHEVITDGVEDYDYLALLRDAVSALRKLPTTAQPHHPTTALLRRAEAALEVPKAISSGLTEFGHDPEALLKQRERVAALLEQVRAALPAAAWQKVLRTEAPLSPAAPKTAPPAPVALPFRCDFEREGGMMPWASRKVGPVAAEHGAVEGMGGKRCALSRGEGKGWADWESPYLKVTPGKRYAVRLSALADLKAGAARVFLFKYAADGRPLDLAVGARAIGPAFLGNIQATGKWEKRRFVRQMEGDVALVRLYVQCFGIQGQVALDDVSVVEVEADPGLVDDCDEVGFWQPGFPEASVARETATVHQGDAALRFTVKVDHKGGEAKYPIGWPSLRWHPAPPLDWSGKKALTFWVYATTSRDALPARAVNLSIKSTDGDAIALPLTFSKGAWQQVTVPLAGKKLPAVSQIQFFVEEACYQDGDEVSFIVDDLRVE